LAAPITWSTWTENGAIGVFLPLHPIAWLVPPGGIVLHHRDRPLRGEQENPLPGTVAEVVIFGDMAQVAFMVDGSGDAPLAFSVPARRSAQPGATR
jgi:molybdate transport system ATP-binding protein